MGRALLLAAVLGMAPQGLVPGTPAAADEPPAPAPSPAPAPAPTPQALRSAWQAVAGRQDDAGHAAQRAVAQQAAAGGEAARALLWEWLAAAGPSQRRQALLLMAAVVQDGSPADLERVVQHVERAQDARLAQLLDGVLGGARQPAARRHLREVLLPRAAPALRGALARAVGAQRDPGGLAPLLGLLSAALPDVRLDAVDALGLLGDVRALGPLQALLGQPDPALRAAAARALGMLESERALPALEARLDDPDPRVVEAAATALGLLGRPAAIDALLARLGRAPADDLRVADSLVRALERITGQQLGSEAAPWQAWWEVARRAPFVRATPAPGGRTLEGLRYHGFPVRSSRLVFVLDVSRSMGWNGRLERAQEELVRVLEALPRSTRFNIVAFSDRPWRWEAGLVAATRGAVRRAVEFVRRQQPMAGTASHEALAAAFADLEADTIFFLSDGQPAGATLLDPELILADVALWNRTRRVRVHTIAFMIGDTPAGFAGLEDPERALAFLRRLAAENDGESSALR